MSIFLVKHRGECFARAIIRSTALDKIGTARLDIDTGMRADILTRTPADVLVTLGVSSIEMNELVRRANDWRWLTVDEAALMAPAEMKKIGRL